MKLENGNGKNEYVIFGMVLLVYFGIGSLIFEQGLQLNLINEVLAGFGVVDNSNKVMVVTYAYASVFHFLYALIFSEKAEQWVNEVRWANIVYLIFRMIGMLILTLWLCWLASGKVEKLHYSYRHAFYSLLVTNFLLGSWARNARDLAVGVAYKLKGDNK